MKATASKEIGLIRTTITVANLVDEILAERGFISADRIRSVTLKNVIVDTGATRLCLPTETISQLGLPLDKEIDTKTAVGVIKARLFKRLSLSIEGRKGEFDCAELPGCEEALLGAIPLEGLGLQPDIINQRLIVLPESGVNTYHLAM